MSRNIMPHFKSEEDERFDSLENQNRRRLLKF
jgi:hypothetical protein